eukprot:4246642-Prymnesium_polylepis.1
MLPPTQHSREIPNHFGSSYTGMQRVCAYLRRFVARSRKLPNAFGCIYRYATSLRRFARSDVFAKVLTRFTQIHDGFATDSLIHPHNSRMFARVCDGYDRGHPEKIRECRPSTRHGGLAPCALGAQVASRSPGRQQVARSPGRSP